MSKTIMGRLGEIVRANKELQNLIETPVLQVRDWTDEDWQEDFIAREEIARHA